MVSTRLSGLVSALAVVLGGTISLSAHAQESSPPVPPLYFWGVQQSGGGQDTTLMAAIRKRLQQTAVSVEPLPASLAKVRCAKAECPQKLRDAAGAVAGRIIGAYFEQPAAIDPNISQDVRLWWLDAFTGKIIRRRLSYRGDVLAERLAREAAFLVEQAPDLTAAPACNPAPLNPPEGDDAGGQTTSARGFLARGVTLSLNTTLGAKVPTKNLRDELQNSLSQMGLRPLSPGGGARLAIELQGSTEDRKHSSVIQTVLLTLSGSGLSRQLRLYCSPESCGRDLFRFLRVNTSVLLDGVEKGTASADAIARAAAPGCVSPSPALLPIASLDPVPPQTTSPPPTELREPSGPTEVPPVPSNPMNQRALCIAGGTLLGVGIAGIVASAVLLAKDKTPTGNKCYFDKLQMDCLWQTGIGSTIGLVGSSLGVATGVVLVGLSYRHPSKKGSPCQQ